MHAVPGPGPAGRLSAEVTDVALILVAVGAILIWFLIAPFLKPTPFTTPSDFDPRVTCTLCDELRDPEEVIEREFGAGRYQFICGSCLAGMVEDFHSQHGRMPTAPPPPPA